MILLLLLWGCVSGGEVPQEAAREYDGTGFYQAKQQATLIHGELQHSRHSGESILLEARHSIPCEYGRCPVIGTPPVASMTLPGPGPFTFSLTQTAKDLVLIATCRGARGETRIAHTWLQNEDPVLNGVSLSLDRPYPPLR